MFKAEILGSWQISGRGVVIAGILTEGDLPKVGSVLVIDGANKPSLLATFAGVEMGPLPPRFGILLRGIAVEDIAAGDLITVTQQSAPITLPQPK